MESCYKVGSSSSWVWLLLSVRLPRVVLLLLLGRLLKIVLLLGYKCNGCLRVVLLLNSS